MSQDFECIHIIIRCDNHFEENLVNFFCCCLVNDTVSNQYTTESRYRITCQCIFPSLQHSRTGSQAASVIMFQDSESKILELVDQVNSSVDIKKIVIRNFFSVNLIEHCLQVSVEITFLMWIFTVTKLFLAVHRTTEGRTFAGIEIIEDSRIIVRRNGKRFFCHPTAFFEWRSGSVLH